MKEETLNELIGYIRKIEKTNVDLQSKIDKATEYIEKHKETREHYEPYGTPMGNPNYITTHIFGYYELLNILKGEDK